MVPSGGLCPGRSHLEARFPLRCFQRLSLPNIATRQCHWRDNRNTRGSSTPVLSYYEQPLSNLQRPWQIGTELSHDVLNPARDRKSTRLNSSHGYISYAVFCLQKKK